MELYLHSPMHLPGLVHNFLSGGGGGYQRFMKPSKCFFPRKPCLYVCSRSYEKHLRYRLWYRCVTCSPM